MPSVGETPVDKGVLIPPLRELSGKDTSLQYCGEGEALMGKAGCLPVQVTSKQKPERSRSYPEKEEGRYAQNCGGGVSMTGSDTFKIFKTLDYYWVERGLK